MLIQFTELTRFSSLQYDISNALLLAVLITAVRGACVIWPLSSAADGVPSTPTYSMQSAEYSNYNYGSLFRISTVFCYSFCRKRV
jgi:hypothetical protein